MKYLFILISFLLSIQFSSATEKEYTLQNGNTVLAVSKDGKLLSLQTGNIRYLSLNAPYVVTLEVNAETLNGYYTSVKRKEESLVCIAKLKSVRGTVFHVKDVFTADTENHFRMDREVVIDEIGKGDEYFNSYFGPCNAKHRLKSLSFLFRVFGIRIIKALDAVLLPVTIVITIFISVKTVCPCHWCLPVRKLPD